MMLNRNLLFLCLLLVASCRTMPPFKPVTAELAPQIRSQCARIFPTGKWQFVHSIETVGPNDKTGRFIGITIIDADTRRIDAVITTIEGFTLFNGSHNGEPTIRRAMPPFDSQPLIQGLFEDIRLMFYEPRGPQATAGFFDHTAAGCRYRTVKGNLIDVNLKGDRQWQIRQYASDGRKLRTVVAQQNKAGSNSSNAPIPGHLELIGHQGFGYRLKFTLVEAVPITK